MLVHHLKPQIDYNCRLLAIARHVTCIRCNIILKLRRNTNHWSRFLRNRYHVQKLRIVPPSGTTWRLTNDRALGEAIRGIIIIYCLIRNLYHYFNKVKKKSLDTYLVKVPKCLAISDSQSFVSYSGSTDQRLRKI